MEEETSSESQYYDPKEIETKNTEIFSQSYTFEEQKTNFEKRKQKLKKQKSYLYHRLKSWFGLRWKGEYKCAECLYIFRYKYNLSFKDVRPLCIMCEEKYFNSTQEVYCKECFLPLTWSTKIQPIYCEFCDVLPVSKDQENKFVFCSTDCLSKHTYYMHRYLN